MKKIFVITALALSQLSCLTSTPSVEVNNENKTIEVIGSSEMMIQPDQILLNIGLKSRSDNTRNKVLKVLAKHNVTEDKITLNKINNHRDWYYYSNRDYLNYDVLIDSSVNSENLMYDLKPLVYTINVIQKRHTKIQNHIKKVKTEAIKAAKYKASYLLEAVDEKLGHVIAVEEIITPVPDNNNWWSYQQNYPKQSVYSNRSFDSEEEQIPNISQEKLRYEVKVIFEII